MFEPSPGRIGTVQARFVWLLIGVMLATAAVHWPIKVRVALLAGLGFAFTSWLIARADADRVCVRVALWSYSVKVLLAIVLYCAAHYQWPFVRAYAGSEGFWLFGDDAQAHHNLASAIARFWERTGVFPPITFTNWSYTLYVAIVYRLLGSHPLYIEILNAWCGTLICWASLVIFHHLHVTPASKRLGLSLFAFWPSLILWSTEPLKEPVVLTLIMLGLCALVSLLGEERQPRLNVMIGRVALLAATSFTLSLFRGYMGFAFGLAALAGSMLIMRKALWARAWGSMRRGLLISATVVCSILAASKVDLVNLVTPAYPVPTASVAASKTPTSHAASSAQPSLAASSAQPSLAASSAQPSLAVSGVRAKEAASATYVPPSRIPASVTQKDAKDNTSIVGTSIRQVLVHADPRSIESLRRSVEGLRKNFVAAGGHSAIDPSVHFHRLRNILTYLPRGLLVVFFAPFPWQWFDLRGRTGAFRVFAALEAMLVYLLTIGFLIRIRDVRRHARLLQIVVIALFVFFVAVPMALTVANLGTLFRLRLQFLLPSLLIFCAVDVPSVYREWLRQVRMRLARWNAH